jgi:hypothetical protein
MTSRLGTGKQLTFFYSVLAHSIHCNRLEARQVSREEHKIIYSGFRISGMALSNQSDLPRR